MAYAKYRTCNITGEKGSFWTVEIHKKDFSGASTQINTSGEGFEITWNGRGGTRDRVFLGSECKLNLIVENNTDEAFIYDTISAGNQGYYIRIYKSNDPLVRGDLWWFGWVQPAFDKIQNMPYPYIYQLTSTDSYGYFNKQKEKTFTGNTEKTAPHKLKDIFRDTLLTDMKIFSSTANDSPAPLDEYLLRTVLDWRQTTDSYTEDPADLYYIAKGNVKDETQTDPETGATILTDKPFDYKSQDVFNGLLKAFNAVGFLAEGKYNIIQPNSLKGNVSGNIRAWEYNKTTDSALQVPNILLTIDQDNNNILAGSSITYEPSFESVKVHYKKGVSIFNVGHQQDLSSLIYAGTLVEQSDAQLQLQFFAKHRETINTADINYPTNQIVHHTFKTTSILTIKATSGTSNRYLVQDTDGLLVWQNTSGTITIERGYNADITNLMNSVNGFCDGMPKNAGLDSFSGNSNLSYGPCSTSLTNSNAQQNFTTEIKFTASIPFPDISPADIEIQVATTNDYFKFSSPNTLPLTNPTVQSLSTECEFIQLSAQLTSEQNSPGLTFTASFDGNSASESFDLGDITLGQSVNIGADPANNKMYTFQYLDGTIYKSVNNFQRANPTPDDPTNATFLLAKEFFELQTEPLEILQADIKSFNISPLKLIKYSINNDTNFKYYTFLGGTFKAQSEVLSGEWFALSTVNNTITEGTPIPDNPFTPPIGFDLLNTVKNVTSSIFDVHKTALDNNGHGPISTVIASNTSTNKVNISAGVNGSINSGQKLVLTLPDGSNPIILTASSSADENDVEVDVNSFTTNIIYPVGSVLSPLSYEINGLAKTALGNAATAQDKANTNETNIGFNTTILGNKANSASPSFTGTVRINNLLNVETAISNNTAKISYDDASLVASHTTDIAANTTKADDNQTNIATNTAGIASNVTAISNKADSSTVTTNTNNIATNVNDISTNANNIATKADSAGPVFTGTIQIPNITDLESYVTTNKNDITSNDSDISTNAAGILLNNNNLTNQSALIQTNTNAISNKADASTVTQNTTDIATNLNSISSINNQVVTNTGAISSNASDISDKANSADPVFTGTIQIPNISDLESYVSTNKTDIASNVTAIADKANSANPVFTGTIQIPNITNLESYITTNKSDITANAGDITTNTSGLATNSTAIGVNSVNISSVTTKANNNETDIASNSGTLSTHATLIGANANSITTNVTAIGTKAPTASPTFTGTIGIPNIANVETAISNNTTKSNANETDIASNSSSIITNGSNILSNTTSITSVTNKANANETDIATNVTNITAATNKSNANETDIATNSNLISANNLLISANTNLIDTKIKSFFSNTQPTVNDGIKVGDIWFDTSTTPNTIKRFNVVGQNATTEIMQAVGNDKTDIAAGSEKLVTGAAIADKISTLSGTPAGSDTQVQFNNSGAFGGTNLLKVTGANELTIGGTNTNTKLNAGADIILGADVAGGTTSTIQYLDSGSTERVMLGAYATDVVVLSNRAADGIVEIRANTSTAGSGGELTIATFKDTSVDFLADAELRGTNIGNIFDLTAYLTAVDFTMSTDRSKVGYSRTNGAAVRVDSTTVGLLATFQIPIGYKATHVQVNGSSSSSTFDVYACDVANNTNTSLTSSPSVNTDQILSSAQSGVAGKYLSIKYSAGSTSRDVYGAKITLERL